MNRAQLFAPLLAVSSLCAYAAFDSAAWFAKRAAYDADAARLRAAYTNSLAHVDSPAENVDIPVEKHDDGSVKLSIAAKKAQFFIVEGLIWGEGVCVRKFDEEGKVTAQIDATHCVIDRVSRSGWVEGHARVDHHGTVMDGDDVYFASSNGYVRVYRNAVIVSDNIKAEGLR